ALPLLVGAGLMVRSFAALMAIDPGFDARGVVAMEVSVSGTASVEPGRRAVLWPELVRRVQDLPGVASAGGLNHLPLAGDIWGLSVAVAGAPPRPPGDEEHVLFRAVLPGYFQTMGIPLARGRAIEAGDRDGAPAVVVVNQRFAESHWPGED